MPTTLSQLLETSVARHSHLCPRQVLGARIGLAGAAALNLDLPRNDTRASSPSAGKRLLIIIETDGCFADGIEAATGCTIGHRTLRVEDYGKIAATFIDVKTGQAVRVAPRLDVRERAYLCAPDEPRHYFAQLKAYQVMPDYELLSIQPVQLTVPIEAIISRAGVRVNCDVCGEEIINEREIEREGSTLCRSCAGQGYYQLVADFSLLPVSEWIVRVDSRTGE
ncbi:MAG: TraR/DksA C4-type zinc finger protein [Chloroflexi bacterium]|nr:TraR/DksA C4-type zinc finger protein [Chloroflexota bacterium]